MLAILVHGEGRGCLRCVRFITKLRYVASAGALVISEAANKWAMYEHNMAELGFKVGIFR